MGSIIKRKPKVFSHQKETKGPKISILKRPRSQEFVPQETKGSRVQSTKNQISKIQCLRERCFKKTIIKGPNFQKLNNQKTKVWKFNLQNISCLKNFNHQKKNQKENEILQNSILKRPASQIVIIEMSKEINDQGPKSQKKNLALKVPLPQKCNSQETDVSRFQFSRDQCLKISIIKQTKVSRVQSSKIKVSKNVSIKRPLCRTYESQRTNDSRI